MLVLHAFPARLSCTPFLHAAAVPVLSGPVNAARLAAMLNLSAAASSTALYFPRCRLHFATNLGVAGGLLLLASFGAGRFTVDAMLKPKKKE